MKVKVMIVDQNTLKLESDAKKGDTIDLRDISQLDTAVLHEKIKELKDAEYNKLLESEKEKLNNQSKLEFAETENGYKKQILNLENDLKNKEQTVKSGLLMQFEKEKSELNLKITNLENKNQNILNQKGLEIKSAVNESETPLKIKIVNLENKLLNIEKEYGFKIDNLNTQNELNIKSVETDLKQKLSEKDLEINLLKREKSVSVKRLGENLENWCNQEYLTYAVSGFNTCTFEKDNTSVKDDGDSKGTKADYIFKVYANETRLKNELLTSAVLEMKSEDPTSKDANKKKNSDHYKKLDTDRIKKNAEYALLVSELEIESDNDSPIKKVPEYDKMYVVRPQYFVIFLSIISSLGLKYKDIMLEHVKEELEFKDAKELLEEFEQMKTDILDKSLKNLENHISKIKKNSDSIIKAADEINESVRLITESHLNAIRSKIENFRINKITKKVSYK